MLPEKSVELYPDLIAAGPAVFVKSSSLLVFGDVHVGYEEMLNRAGFLLPRFHLRDVLSVLDPLLNSFSPGKIVINGDLKHEFGTISGQEWRDTLRLIDVLSEKAEIVLVRGNHDTILGPVAKKRNLSVVDSFFLDGILVMHGHKLPDFSSAEFKNSDLIVISHEHPSLTLSRASRRERFKCFLKCRFRGKDLIVLPSVNPLVEGSDILAGRPLSPFIDSYDGCEVWVLSDENDILYFGSVASLLSEMKNSL